MTKIDPTKQPKIRIKDGVVSTSVETIDYRQGFVLLTNGKRLNLEDVEFVTDEPDKVSDCCGVEINWRWKSVPNQNAWPFCKSCEEPCEAVEEKPAPIERVNLDIDLGEDAERWTDQVELRIEKLAQLLAETQDALADAGLVNLKDNE